MVRKTQMKEAIMNKLLLTLVLAGGTIFAANARGFHGHHRPAPRGPKHHARVFVPPPRPVIVVPPPRPVFVPPPPRVCPPPPPPRHRHRW